MPIDLPVEIEMLTPEEAQEIFHTNARRAGNFAKFVGVMNQRDIGDGWSIWIDRVARENGLDSDEYAKQSKYNWNEAAAKRVKRTAIDPELVATDDTGRAIRRDTDEVLVNYDATTHMYDMPAPVKLTWKSVAHTEQREVENDKGVKGMATVTVIDRFQVVVKESEIRHRAARIPREVVAVAPEHAVGKSTGDVVALADGRTAKLGKNGKWYAPKASPAISVPTNGSIAPTSLDSSSNNTDGTTSSDPSPSVNGVASSESTPESAPEPALASAGNRQRSHK